MKAPPRTAVALAVALSCVALQARADAYEVALIRAVAAKERALDVNEPERWQEALRSFREADAVRPTLETRYEIGFAAERLRADDVAVEAYESALALGLGGTASEHARDFVSARAPSMARLDVRGPAGVTVAVGGVPRGQLPLAESLVVFAGNVGLSLGFPDGHAESRSVTAPAGVELLVEVAGSPPPRDEPAQAKSAPPAPRSTPPLHADHVAPSRTLGWALTGGGFVVGATGAVLALVSNRKLDASRLELDEFCQVPDGPDACRNAEPGHLDDAQNEVNAIATWKAVRTGSWVAVGAGAASLGAGLFLLSGGSELIASPEPHGVRFRVRGVF